MVSLLDFINSISYDIQDVSARTVGAKVDLLSTRGEVVRPVRLRTPPPGYIFIMKSYTRYTIKRKWKKDKEKIKTQNKKMGLHSVFTALNTITQELQAAISLVKHWPTQVNRVHLAVCVRVSSLIIYLLYCCETGWLQSQIASRLPIAKCRRRPFGNARNACITESTYDTTVNWRRFT